MRKITVSIVFLTLFAASCKSSGFRSNEKTSKSPVDDSNKSSSANKGTPTIAVNDSTESIEKDNKPPANPNELQINQTCGQPVQLLSMQTKISYPMRQKCKFNVKPNLGPRQGYVQASESSLATLKLPEQSEICSMKLESAPNAKLKYDDFIVLTLDDFVLFSSNKNLVLNLAKTSTFYKWDFSKVVGTKIENFGDAPYCVGPADRCKFPGSDDEGPVLLNLNNADISGIAKTLLEKTSVPINLIATGDNDDNSSKLDCYHEALELTVTFNYIKTKK